MNAPAKKRFFQFHKRTVLQLLMLAGGLFFLNAVFHFPGKFPEYDEDLLYSGSMRGFPIGYSFSGSIPTRMNPPPPPPPVSRVLPDGSIETEVQGAGFVNGACTRVFEERLVLNIFANLAILIAAAHFLERRLERSPQPDAPLLQFHLATCVLLVCVAGLLLGANMAEREPNVFGERLHGWPFGFFGTWKDGSLTYPVVDIEVAALNAYVALMILVATCFASEKLFRRSQSAKVQ